MPVCTHCNLRVVCNVNMSTHNWSWRNTCAKEPWAICLPVTLTFPAVPFSSHAGQAQVRGVPVLYDAGVSFHGKIDVGENGNKHMAGGELMVYFTQ